MTRTFASLPAIGGLLTLVLSAALWGGCDNLGRPDAPASPVQRSAPGAATWLAEGGAASGHVVVRSVEGRRIVVSVDAAEAGERGDGRIDAVFTLALESPLETSTLAREYPQARLVHARGNLFVVPADGSEGLHLYVEGQRADDATAPDFGAEEQAALGEILTATPPPTRAVAGYGLARRVVSTEAPLALARQASAYVPIGAEGAACGLSGSLRLNEGGSDEEIEGGGAQNCGF